MATKASESRSAQRKDGRQKTGCLIWLLLLLATLALFVVKWDDIQSTLKATGFVEAVKAKEAPPPPEKGDGSLEPGTKDTGATAKPADKPAARTEPKPPEASKPEAAKPEAAKPEAAKPEASKPEAGRSSGQPEAGAKRPGSAPSAAAPVVAAPVELIKSTRVAVLYFVRVDDDGSITRHEVKRTVSASDSPMTDALEALMAGPTASELGKGLMSLIPLEARLVSAQVRGSTAYLNFNEAFMYNRYGIEGYAGQLKQIVYTATGFSTVKDVQVLIEGQKRDYLGGDGVYIGKPLSRASF